MQCAQGVLSCWMMLYRPGVNVMLPLSLLTYLCAQAQAAQFAAVWLWNLADWTPAGRPLEAHSLTVTHMAFSSTGQHLLTVSRDRTIGVWECQAEGENHPAWRSF